MALKVVSNPSNAVLKVATNYPQATLKVVSNTGMQGSNYNPQQTAPSMSLQGSSYNPQPASYNPQANYQVPADWATQQAIRMKAEQDQAILSAQIERKRVADAKNNEINTVKGGFVNTFKDKVSFGDLRRQRGGRELAIKYAKDNEASWFPYLEARKRKFEQDVADKQNWLIQNQDDPNFEKMVADAQAWANSEQEALIKDANDYNLEQTKLYQYADTPLNGKLATVARFTKNFGGGIGSQLWNTTGAVLHFPSRLINTVGNLNTPDRVIYQTGGTSLQSSAGIKNAWNNTEKQRNFNIRPYVDQSFNRDHAIRLITNNGAGIVGNDAGKGSLQRMALERKYQNATSDVEKEQILQDLWKEFNRANRNANSLQEFGADPVNFIGGGEVKAGAGALERGFFKLAGKSETARNALISFEAMKSLASESKAGKALAWLNKPILSKQAQWLEDNKLLITKQQALGNELKDVTDVWRASKNAEAVSFADKVRNLTPTESDLLQKFISDIIPKADKFGTDTTKAFHSWDQLALPRGFNKAQASKIEDLAREWKRIGDKLYGQQLEQFGNIYGGTDQIPRELRRYRRGYVPRVVTQSEGKMPFISKFMKDRLSGGWWTKRKTDFSLQSTSDLANSFEKRITGQLWRQNPEASWLRKNAGTYLDELNATSRELQARHMRDFELNKSGRVGELLNKPMNLWKKSVLKYRPAWYVNNMAWNIPASVSAGGAGTFSKYGELIKAMLKEKTFSPEIMKSLPDEVASQVGKLWGFERKVGKKVPFATKIENFSRSAAFMALKDKGLSDAEALKQVNKWLFDYGTKRWEQPLKAVLPFWSWQKNLGKLAVTMPFTNPRLAKAYSTFYDKFYTQPQNQIPDKQIDYVDESTGRHIKYNLRDKYKGKLKIGNRWINTPFNAMTPDQIGQIGVNPLISFMQDFLTSSDKFGRSNTDRPAWQLGAEKFPQFNVGKDFIDRNKIDTQSWFSKSGYGKRSSGADPSAPNYKESLDNKKKFGKTALSFLGVPSNVTQDLNAEAKRARYNQFNTDFFNIDWEKRLQELLTEDKATAYDKLQAEKEALASKYGFNFQKDISRGEWAKYDTPTSINTKNLKEQARTFNDAYWNDYQAVPKAGVFERSKKRPFWIDKFTEWKDKSTFKDNPYYTIPYTKNEDGTRKYISPRDLKATETALDNKPKNRTAVNVGGKWFKNQASADRYRAFVDRGGAQSEKKKAFDFWQKYYAETDKEKRKALIDANPQYSKNTTPTTQAEWTALKKSNSDKFKLKARKLAGFSQMEASLMQGVLTRIDTKKKVKSRKVVFKV